MFSDIQPTRVNNKAVIAPKFSVMEVLNFLLTIVELNECSISFSITENSEYQFVIGDTKYTCKPGVAIAISSV